MTERGGKASIMVESSRFFEDTYAKNGNRPDEATEFQATFFRIIKDNPFNATHCSQPWLYTSGSGACDDLSFTLSILMGVRLWEFEKG